MTIAPPMPAWTCAKCGQKNAGWSSECGRCQFAYAMPDSPAPDLDALIERRPMASAMNTWTMNEWMDEAAAALVQLREENARRCPDCEGYVWNENGQTWHAMESPKASALRERAERAEQRIKELEAQIAAGKAWRHLP